MSTTAIVLTLPTTTGIRDEIRIGITIVPAMTAADKTVAMVRVAVPFREMVIAKILTKTRIIVIDATADDLKTTEAHSRIRTIIPRLNRPTPRLT